MQGWQDLPTQIFVGVIVNAIIGILCWLMKREYLFFKRQMRSPRSYQLKIFPKWKKNCVFQRPLNAALSLSMTSNTSITSLPRHFKKIPNQ